MVLHCMDHRSLTRSSAVRGLDTRFSTGIPSEFEWCGNSEQTQVSFMLRSSYPSLWYHYHMRQFLPYVSAAASSIVLTRCTLLCLLIWIDRLLWLTWSLIDLNTAVSRTSAWGLLVSATWSQCVRIRCQRACCGPHDGPKLVKADVSYKPTWRMSTSACPLIRPYAWCALMGGLFTRNTARKIENYREILKMS